MDLIDTAEVAELLGCSRRKVHRLVAAGVLTPTKRAPGGPNGVFLFDRTDVERLLDAA